MPRPPILPTIDWSEVFKSGETYEEWIAKGENEEHRAKMEEGRAKQIIAADAQEVVRNLGGAVHVIAIAEDWCGDVVRHVPVLQRLADLSANLQVRYLARDSNLDVFARFLTNGGEAIPKFIFFSADFVEVGNWGPMQSDCREVIARGKACGDGTKAREIVSQRYEANPDKSQVVEELVHLIRIASATAP